MVAPVFALLDLLLGDWQAVAGGSGPPVANGQFILMRREAWEASGGYEGIRNVVIDDVAVVSRLRSAGFRTGFLRAGGLRVRMYRGLGETFRGWRRNLGGLFGPHPGTVAGILALLLLPVAALLAFALAGLWVEAVLLWTAGAAASMIFRTSGGHSPLWGLLFPLDALLLAAVLALGARDQRRGRLLAWKGREMRV